LTYLGGSGTDLATGIAVDNGGQAYVVGQTASVNFCAISHSSCLGGGHGRLSGSLQQRWSQNLRHVLRSSGGDAINGIALNPTQKIVYFGGETDGSAGLITSAGAYRTTPVGFSDGFVTSYAYNDLTLTPSTIGPISIAAGGPSQNQTVTLAFTNTVNPYTISAVTYSGPDTPGTACTGWLSAVNAGPTSVSVTEDPTTAGRGPGTNYKATFTIDGGADNGPQTVTVKLNVTNTFTPPPAATRYYELGTTLVSKNATTNGISNNPGGNDAPSVTGNAETFTATAGVNNNYTTSIAYNDPMCSGFVSVPSATAGPSSTNNVAVSYNTAVLTAVNIDTLYANTTGFDCIATVTYTSPGVAPNPTETITMNLVSRLLPNPAGNSLGASPGPGLTFNFATPTAVNASQNILIQGEHLQNPFNAQVVTNICTSAITLSPTGLPFPPYL
jgi:hypothetical protein